MECSGRDGQPTLRVAAVADLATMSLPDADGEAGAPGDRRRRPGVVFAAKYRLERLLGEGGMGSVWAATHLHTRKRVALKFIKGGGNPQSRRRLLREARAATVIQHPNLLGVHDVLDSDDEVALVMDLLQGESLGSYLAQKAPLSLTETARVLGPVLSAIATAHAAGVVHRDLKPDNIFVTTAPDGSRTVKVLDFGLAKLTADDGDAAASVGLTRSGDIVGTPSYMAPEQAFGERDIDARADVWALGVILYECLSGQRPLRGENLGQMLKQMVSTGVVPLLRVAREVPPDVAALVGRMLSIDREGRPADVRAIERVLAAYADEGARPPAPARAATGRRGSWSWIAGAAALVVTMGMAAALVWPARPLAARAAAAPVAAVTARSAERNAAAAAPASTAPASPDSRAAAPAPTHAGIAPVAAVDTAGEAQGLPGGAPVAATTRPAHKKRPRGLKHETDETIPLFTE